MAIPKKIVPEKKKTRF